MALFRKENKTIYSAVTFATKNKSANNYWANPNFECLGVEWSIILNDDINCKLYLFNIPAYSIQKNELKARSDNPKLIDLQIKYGGENFTDTRSDYHFSRFFVYELSY